jgi:hypothetical protein
MRTTLYGVAMSAILALALPASAQQTALRGLIGQWHQPSSDETCRTGAYETWFDFTGITQRGILSGTWRLACVNKSGYLSNDGTLTPDTPVAKLLPDGVVTVTISLSDRNEQLTYAFRPSGRTAPGFVTAQSGSFLALKLEKM